MDLPTTKYETAASESNSQVRTEATGSLLSKISFYLLLAAAFLTPLLFFPWQFAPVDVVKTFFVGFVVIIAALLYAIDAVKTKSFAIPRSLLGYSAIAIVFSTIISALASGSFAKSFLGQGFEITSASYILLMILTSYLVSRFVIKDREFVFKIYSVIFVSFVILALFHIVRLFAGADLLSLGVFRTITATPVGKWYDFAAFVGATGILSLIGVKLLPLRGSLRKLLVVSLVVSGLLLFVINSSFIWGLIALVTLAIGVYEFFTASPKGEGVKRTTSRVSILTVIVFVIAVACMWKGNVIAAPVVEKFKAQYGELLLPWQMTLDVTTGTLKQSPVWGAGPNKFGFQYLQNKPVVINQTPFWNAEFTSGFGLLPTLIVTQGIVGAVVWVLFLLSFIWMGIKALKRITDPLKKFFVASSFFSASFLWLMMLVYNPSQATIFLTAIFTGIFVALLVSEGIIAEKVVASVGGRSRGLAPFVLYATIIVLVVWLGAYAKKSIAITHFQKGVKELSAGKTDAAQARFMKALSWDESDIYYQALSETNIMKINALAQEIQNESASGATPDQKKGEQIVALITDSLKYTKIAQEIDKQNYYNYLAEARISEIGTTLKIDNAYANAKASYANAIGANPYNPSLFLSLARLEASQNNLTEAQQYIGRALQLKSNYIDAIFFLSQLQVANNQLQDAMTSTQVAIQLNPEEPLLYFQLGLLEYNAKNYAGAIQAFEKAVSLRSEYANARYFLGLSYARLGRNADAIAQFEELAKTYSDNAEVNFILSNLQEGKSPFADAQPPIDSKPEKRKTLPVTEKEDTSSAKKTDTTKTTATKKSS